MRYKLQTGSFAWVLQRVTGIALTLYIFLHLYVLSHLRDPVKYESMMELMRTPFLRLTEAGLLGLVIAHAFNGFRVILVEVGVPTRLQKRLFWSAFIIGTFIFLWGSVLIIRGH